MKKYDKSRGVTPPHDAPGGKSVEIERFAWSAHAKARGIATPEYLGCGDAWDVAPSRGAHNVRPATVLEKGRTVALRTQITRGKGETRQCEVQTVHVLATVAHLPEMPEAPEYPALWRSKAQLAILALDRAEYAQLKASGRAHKLPTTAKRARPRGVGLVSEHLEDFRTPSTPAIGAGRISPPRAIGARGGWCAEYAHTTDTPRVDRGPARFARVRQSSCHARRVKHVACKASIIRAIDARKGSGTIIAALPLTPHLVRALEGGPWQYTYCHDTMATYATLRGWHSVCTTPEGATPPAVVAPTVPTQPAQPAARVVPVEVALARGLLARKMRVIGTIDAVVTPRVSND